MKTHFVKREEGKHLLTMFLIKESAAGGVSCHKFQRSECCIAVKAKTKVSMLMCWLMLITHTPYKYDRWMIWIKSLSYQLCIIQSFFFFFRGLGGSMDKIILVLCNNVFKSLTEQRLRLQLSELIKSSTYLISISQLVFVV